MADASPWLLVGLGNPGAKYADNRHNVGFMVLDAWRDRFVPAPPWSEKFKAQTCSISSQVPGGGRCVMLKPQTFMNLSGESVGPAARYNRTPPEKILVVHDELDFEVGRVALKKGGGHGGHNGLRDIIRVLGSRDFLRIRVGIGRPKPPFRGDVSNWVLTNFEGDDAISLPDTIDRASKAVDCVMAEGVREAMKQINTSPKSTSSKSADAATVEP
jgi:PTH1 family peptidyl-tRNA hydrolase